MSTDITVKELEEHFKISHLNKEVSDGHILEISTFLEAWKIVAPHLGLNKGEIESIGNDGNTEDEKRLLMLQRWKQALIFKATYKRLLEALLSIKRADQARKVCQMIVDGEDTIGMRPTKASLMDELIGSLSYTRRWEDTQEKEAAQKPVISHFISQCIKSGYTLESVKEQLQKLHSEELLISKEVLATTQLMAADKYHTCGPAPEPVPSMVLESDVKPKDAEVEPLFCKDTIYHASVCSHAVSTCNAGDYQKFFKNKEFVPDHAFKAVSFSRSKDESFLIAQKGESTFYFAFKGKLSLSDWANSKDHKSFNEGVMAQCEMFPIRYIIELLNKQCRIVLTGFSFGGLLASTIAAHVWHTRYISSDLLKKNMTCITFGQPHVEVEIIKKVARRRPEMVTTINAIFITEDHMPSLMGLLDECWSTKILNQQTQTESELGVQLSSAFTNTSQIKSMPFEDQTTHLLLQKFSKLQSTATHEQDPAEVIKDLKDKLEEVLSSAETLKSFSPSYTTHTISESSSEGGLVWMSDTGSRKEPFKFTFTTVTQYLTKDLYNKHSMSKFSDDIFVGYLDKDPKYSISKRKESVLGDVEDIKPEIHGIQIHHHGNQSAIVIEGRNLWFCYQVSFRGHKVLIPASDISGSSIRFNLARLKESNQELEKEYVVFHNYFKSRPFRQVVKVHEKKFSTTTRQEQLAKLTPSQVIELGYLSALLEQHCDNVRSPTISHKFEVIQTFLEKVVKVVPFESIVYAIANGNQQTVMQCVKALKAHEIAIPTTSLMSHGLLDAAYHLMYGVPMDLIHSMRLKALEKFSRMPDRIYLRMPNSFMYMESEKLVYAIASPIPGTNFEVMEHEPIIVETDVKHLKPTSEDMKQIAEYLVKLQHMILSIKDRHTIKGVKEFEMKLVSTANIDDLYSVQADDRSVLQSPLNILVTGHKQLAELSRIAKSSSKSHPNQQMLDTVNSIRNNELDTCTSLLGGFMHQNEVKITLSSPHKTTPETSDRDLYLSAPASVGIWALFSLDYSRIQPILADCHGKQLLLKIFDYVKGISGIQKEPQIPKEPEIQKEPVNEFNHYAAKLQFLVQGMTKTVTCNTQYVSYSLERQLVDVCKTRNIDAEIELSKIIENWATLFEGNTLSLVCHRCHPLIARWLKWALMIHNLREELAKYTAVGVVGLVNSGKSKLVNTLFGIEIPTGTTEGKRTTVPFLYNLDESVEGLNVVDFPGVDDKDDSIGELADLLLTIAQIVIFVVDYRKAHTQSAKKWLERLQKENVPFLVCLTFGDKLYAEHMSTKGEHPSKNLMTQIIKEQLSEIQGKLHRVGSHQIQFFSFCQDNDSVLNTDSGREKLKEVGIGTPQQVGEWLVKIFRKDFDQDELVLNKLELFMHRNVALCSL